jgi:hypothetical protein
MKGRYPPPYPPPKTSPERREATRELKRESDIASSPVLRSRFPLDGAVGVIFIIFLVVTLVWGNVGLVLSTRRITREDVAGWVAVDTAIVGAIAWAVYLRRIHRRLRRFARGRCVGCGYDLRVTGERCPECGTIAPLA